MTAATQLAIKYILNVNLQWARSDLGPVDELVASIREHGVMKPLLIQEDFLMLDGARRIHAAQSVGLAAVPVIICRTWADVMEHFRPAELDCRPMDWVDLPSFWGITLKGLHSKHQRIIAGVTRRSRTKNDADGEEADLPTRVYSHYTHDLATLYGVEPATIKLLRDYLVRLNRMQDTFPKFVDGLYSRFPTGEAARDMTKGRYIKSLIERVRVGKLTEADALILYDLRSKDDSPSFTYRRARAQESSVDTEASQVPMQQVENLIHILEQVAMSARSFRNFDTKDVTRIPGYVSRLSESMSAISSMRRRLETAARNQGRTEDAS